jgi:hypothetical protein
VYDDFAPTYTAGSLPLHLLGLACQLSNTLEVRYVAPAEAALLLLGEPDFASHVATVLEQTARARRVRLGADDKAAFLAYYTTVHRGGYRHAKQS